MNRDLGTWVAAGMIFLAAVFATIAIVLFWEGIRDRMRRRAVAKQLERLSADDLRTDEGATGLFRRTVSQSPQWVQSISNVVPQMRDIDILLEQADVKWTAQTFVILSAGFGLAAGLGALIAIQSAFGTLLGVVAGAMVPYFYLRNRRDKRMRAFEEALPEAIDLLGRALRAGHPFSSGLKMVADETQDPIASEFRRVFEEQRFGLSMDEALLGMADRVPLTDVRIFITAVLIQREVGGNLAEILDKLSSVIRQRFSILRQLRTYTAQGRMSGYILGGLPIFLGIVLFVINREDMLMFVQHPLGRVMMFVAVVFQIMGYFWISRIVKIDV